MREPKAKPQQPKTMKAITLTILLLTITGASSTLVATTHHQNTFETRFEEVRLLQQTTPPTSSSASNKANTIWFITFSQKTMTIFKLIGITIAIMITVIILWKKLDLKNYQVKNEEMEDELEESILKMNKNPEEYLIYSTSDHREGVKFFENPLRGLGMRDHITKMQELNRKIYRAKREIKIKRSDISRLKEKSEWVKSESTKLNYRLQQLKNKNKNFWKAKGL